MRSTSNFLPTIDRNTSNSQYGATSPQAMHKQQQLNHQRPGHGHGQHSQGGDRETPNATIKLENRVFYMEKAVARLIHAFESVGGRLSKLEGEQHQHHANLGALSKTMKDLRDANKDVLSKQHMVTERLVGDIHKQHHELTQQTSFMNKEVSDLRDSLQILSSNLQKNFNESLKSAIQQCSDLNIQNSNSIQSLRKLSDQKAAHLQQLLIDSQKRAQTQNSSILDIINANQLNQSEFQSSFKSFFEKFRDSMHSNLTALQESSQEQISYLDNVLRAEVKSRMKSAQSASKEGTFKLGVVQEQLEQNKRDNKRSWDFVLKELEGVQEAQRHAKTANQPLHKIISNVTTQLDELGHQHLSDIKSIMQLNQSTSEKQFEQIKGLQIQMQQIWGRLSNAEQNRQSLNAGNGSEATVAFKSPQSNAYRVRPESYKSEMSSTAAFNAIKQHLSGMPGKPSNDEFVGDYADRDESAMTTPAKLSMESASEFVEASPRPPSSPRPASARPKDTEQRVERMPIAEEKVTVAYTPNDDLRDAVEEEAPAEDEEDEDYDDEYDDDEEEQAQEEANSEQATKAENVEPTQQLEVDVVDDGDIDDLLGDDELEVDADQKVEAQQEKAQSQSAERESSKKSDQSSYLTTPENEQKSEVIETKAEPPASVQTMGDIDALLGDEIVDRKEPTEAVSNEEVPPPPISEQYSEREQNAEEEVLDKAQTRDDNGDGDEDEEEDSYSDEDEEGSEQNDGNEMTDQEKALAMLEQEQSEMPDATQTEQEKALAKLEQEQLQREVNESETEF